MATKPAPRKPVVTQVELEVVLGTAEHAVGKLVYLRNGPRQFSQFSYFDARLNDSRYFDISPDLVKGSGYQLRKAPTQDDSDRWREVARSPDVGLLEAELELFAPAFEHPELDEARVLAT